MRTTWPVSGEPYAYIVHCPVPVWRIDGSRFGYPSDAATPEEAVVDVMERVGRGGYGWFGYGGVQIQMTWRATGYVILVRRVESLTPYLIMLPPGPNRRLSNGVWKFVASGKYKNFDIQQLFTEMDKWLCAIADLQAPQVNAESLCRVAQAFRPIEVEQAWRGLQKARKEGTEFESSLAYPPPTPEACQMSLDSGDFYDFNEGGYPVVSRDVKDVVLQDKHGVDYSLGHFRVKLVVGSQGWCEAKADPIGNNLPNRYEPSFRHPHVSSSNSICLGEAGGMVMRFLSQGHYVMAMDALEAVLRTYNPRSPYSALESWLGEMCRKCGTRTGEMRMCRFCEERMCESCLIACQCGRYACESCASRSYGDCDFCHKIVCPRCATGTPAGNCCKHCESGMVSFSNADELMEAIGRNVCT